MAKKRKTREQKILADLRHNFSHTFASQAPLSVKIQAPIVPSVAMSQMQRTTTLNAYPYLAKDLTKTAILTLGIFVFQIILFLLLKNHALIIPGISY
ncbi:MAG TPA: hypothetical protein VMR59_03105 [Patescibacteria group bacterium]|jgi:hypothetical protein|nr:hypothetical protein [Patescibacteria group bacterium]